jgi:hypothetical protein
VRRTLIALVAAVLLAACARSAATQPTASKAAAFNDADVRFLQDMIPHHQQAIEMAKLVDGRTQRPELVKLATSITASQGAEIRTMQGFLTRWNRPAPAVGERVMTSRRRQAYWARDNWTGSRRSRVSGSTSAS